MSRAVSISAALILGALIAVLLASRSPEQPPNTGVSVPVSATMPFQAPVPGSTTSRETPPNLPPSARDSATDRSAGSGPIADLLRLKGDFAQTAALYQLLVAADVNETRALLAEAERLQDRHDRDAATQIVLTRYMDLDPLAAMEHARGYPPDQRHRQMTGLLILWFRSDATSAADYLKGLPLLDKDILSAALVARNTVVPRGALAYSAANLSRHRGDLEARQLMLQQAQQDPHGAWQTALAEHSPEERMKFLSLVANTWAQADPPAALTAIMSAPGHIQRQLLTSVVGIWAATAPADALSWVQEQPANPSRIGLVTSVLAQMGQSDPHRALQFAESFSGKEREQALAGILGQWAHLDPEAAVAYVKSMPASSDRSQAAEMVLANYARVSPKEAFDWAMELHSSATKPESGQRSARMLTQIMNYWAKDNPAEAASRLSQISDAATRERAAQAVVRGWSGRDLDAANVWVAEQAQPLRDRLQATLTQTLSRYDPVAAERQLGRIRDAEIRDATAARLVASLAYDPTAAEALFRTIESEEHRQRAARALYSQFRAQGLPQAEQYRELSNQRPRK